MGESGFTRTGFLSSRTTGILALSNAVVMFGYGQILPLIPLLMYETLKATEFEVGIAITAFAVSRVIFQAAFGGLSDRYGRKPFIVVPLIGYGIVSVFYLFATQTIHIIGIRVVQGFFSASLWPVSDAIVMDSVRPANRGKAVATMQNAYTAGWIFGPFMGGVLAGVYEFSTPFIVSGVLAFLAAGLSAAFLQETNTLERRRTIIARNGGSTSLSLQDFFPVQEVFHILSRYPALVRVAVIGFLTRLAPSMVFPFLSIFIVSVLAGTTMDAGLVIGVLGATSILSQLSSGIVGDKFGKWRMLEIGAVLSSVSAPLLLFATDLLRVYILLPAASIAIYLSQPMLSALVGDIAQEHERGRAYGAYGLIRDTALIIGPLLGGLMIQLFSLVTAVRIELSIYYLFGLRVVILVGAAVVAVLSLSLIRGVDTVSKDQPTTLEEPLT